MAEIFHKKGLHLHRFRDYSRLQWAMGHRDSALLRTRYIDERDISSPDLLWE